MKKFLALLVLLSFQAHAEKCETIEGCSALYANLTGEKVDFSAVPVEMSLAIAGTDMTPENAKEEYRKYLAMNAVMLIENNKLVPMRHGEFLKSPIYVVEKNKIPQMINKDGLVTFSYATQNDPKKLITRKVRKKLSYKKTKSLNNIVEYSGPKVITISDTYENASKIAAQIIKADQKKLN